MTFFAIVFALLLEQARPLSTQTPVYEGVRAWTRWVSRMLDAGQHRYAWVTWVAAVVVPAALSWAVYALLDSMSVVLGFAWLVTVLYFTLGFRQFSFHFTNVRVALDVGVVDHGGGGQLRGRLAAAQLALCLGNGRELALRGLPLRLVGRVLLRLDGQGAPGQEVDPAGEGVSDQVVQERQADSAGTGAGDDGQGADVAEVDHGGWSLLCEWIGPGGTDASSVVRCPL